MSLLVEARYEKPAILEAYLNEIYLGQRGPTSIHGVGEASLFYFGKPVRSLAARGRGAARRADPQPGRLLAVRASRRRASRAATWCCS